MFAELPALSVEELVEIRSKIDDLTGDAWLDPDLTESDKAALDEALEDMEKYPDDVLPAAEAVEQIRAARRK